MQQKQEKKEDKASYSIAYKGKLVIHDSPFYYLSTLVHFKLN
ncbi:hypothetical protein [Bacteroides ihuae]|nr:hypothetical protein [Bacteroides ihuae]